MATNQLAYWRGDKLDVLTPILPTQPFQHVSLEYLKHTLQFPQKGQLQSKVDMYVMKKVVFQLHFRIEHTPSSVWFSVQEVPLKIPRVRGQGQILHRRLITQQSSNQKNSPARNGLGLFSSFVSPSYKPQHSNKQGTMSNCAESIVGTG